jgi:hypothetical protein
MTRPSPADGAAAGLGHGIPWTSSVMPTRSAMPHLGPGGRRAGQRWPAGHSHPAGHDDPPRPRRRCPSTRRWPASRCWPAGWEGWGRDPEPSGDTDLEFRRRRANFLSHGATACARSTRPRSPSRRRHPSRGDPGHHRRRPRQSRTLLDEQESKILASYGIPTVPTAWRPAPPRRWRRRASWVSGGSRCGRERSPTKRRGWRAGSRTPTLAGEISRR